MEALGKEGRVSDVIDHALFIDVVERGLPRNTRPVHYSQTPTDVRVPLAIDTHVLLVAESIGLVQTVELLFLLIEKGFFVIHHRVKPLIVLGRALVVTHFLVLDLRHILELEHDGPLRMVGVIQRTNFDVI